MSEIAALFGTTGGFGTITGCALISDDPVTKSDRARAQGTAGDELASNLHNTMTEYTSTYEINNATNGVKALILGSVLNSRVITKIAIKTQASDKYNMVEISGHQHGTNPHLNASMKQIAISGLVTADVVPYGAVDYLGGTVGAAAALTSGDITLECQHDDKTGPDGNHVVGQNFDAMATANSDYVGIPTTAAGTGWKVTSNGAPVSNTDFQSTKVTGTQTVGVLALPGA